MNRLSLLSLITLLLISTHAYSVTSQYPCDRVVYENTLENNGRGIRVCFSDAGMSITLDPKMDGHEGIDKRVPLSAITYFQKGVVNTLTFNIDDHTYYKVSNSSQNLRLFTFYGDHLSRAYRLNSPTVDNLSLSLGRYGIRIQ